MSFSKAVIAATDDVQINAWKQRRKSFANPDRADRVGIAPQKKRRDGELREPRRQVFLVGGKPAWQQRIGLMERLLPILPAKPRDIDAAGSDGQHQMGHEIGLLERCSHGDDAAHRLRDQRGGLVDLRHYFGDQIVDAVNRWVWRRGAEAWPSDMDFRGRILEQVSDRIPELRSAQCAGKE